MLSTTGTQSSSQQLKAEIQSEHSGYQLQG